MDSTKRERIDVPRPKKSITGAAGLGFTTGVKMGGLAAAALVAGAFAVMAGGTKAVALLGPAEEFFPFNEGGKKLVADDVDISSSNTPAFQPESSDEPIIITPGLSLELTPPPSTRAFFTSSAAGAIFGAGSLESMPTNELDPTPLAGALSSMRGFFDVGSLETEG